MGHWSEDCVVARGNLGVTDRAAIMTAGFCRDQLLSLFNPFVACANLQLFQKIAAVTTPYPRTSTTAILTTYFTGIDGRSPVGRLLGRQTSTFLLRQN